MFPNAARARSANLGWLGGVRVSLPARMVNGIDERELTAVPAVEVHPRLFGAVERAVGDYEFAVYLTHDGVLT